MCTCSHHCGQHDQPAAVRQGAEYLDWAEEQQPVVPHPVCYSDSHPDTYLNSALLGNMIGVPAPEHMKFSFRKMSLNTYPLQLWESLNVMNFLLRSFVQDFQRN
jgi:hypothetical protein